MNGRNRHHQLPSHGRAPLAIAARDQRLDQGPYYAVKMESGALGTCGGPKTNGHAQVLDWDNNPITGLYATGNAMAAVLGEAYGGAAGTLGRA